MLIPTLGRSREPIATIEGLAQQTRIPDELILVDQNQPELTELSQIAEKYSWINHVRSNLNGVVLNMNRGLKIATGEIIVFVDDDVIPSFDLIEKHLLNYQNSKIGGVAGRVEQAWGDRPLDKINGIGKYHRWSGNLTSNYNAQIRCEVNAAIGCNMSFRKEALIRAGGFDLGFDGNSYFFEPDVCLRVLQLGYSMVFDPSASLKHLMAPSGGARVPDKARHTHYFIKNGIRLYRRHSPRLGLPFYVIKMGLYSILKSLKNLNPKIATEGLRAIREGLKQSIDLKGLGETP